MKKQLIIYLFILIGFSFVHGQNLLPDNSFESWKNTTTLNKWSAVKISGFTLNPPSKVTDKQDGIYAVKLQSVDVTALAKLLGYNVDKMVLPGMLFSGVVDATKMITILSTLNVDSLDFSNGSFQQQITSIVTSGVPIKTKPATISGYYKYTPADTTESCVIGISVFHTDTLKSKSGTDSIARNFVGGTIIADKENSSTTYKYFSAPIIYFNTELSPNEMLVIISNSFSQKVGSTLTVDNFSVEASNEANGVSAQQAEIPFRLIQDYKQHAIQIHLDAYKTVGADIFDAKGSLIYSNSRYESTQKIKLPNVGNYILRIKDGERSVTRKFTVY